MTVCGGPPRIHHRAVELHDSTLRSWKMDGTTLRARLDAYVHESQGEPGVDRGTGWSQDVELLLEEAVLLETPRELPLWILEGEVNGRVLLPLPFSAEGPARIRLGGAKGAFEAEGTRLSLTPVGEAAFVERVDPGSRR